jgi:hypothetical protein
MTVYLCANVVALFVTDADDFRRLARNDEIVKSGAGGDGCSYRDLDCVTALSERIAYDEANHWTSAEKSR